MKCDTCNNTVNVKKCGASDVAICNKCKSGNLKVGITLVAIAVNAFFIYF